jgi:hypothetical protein
MQIQIQYVHISTKVQHALDMLSGNTLLDFTTEILYEDQSLFSQRNINKKSECNDACHITNVHVENIVTYVEGGGAVCEPRCMLLHT